MQSSTYQVSQGGKCLDVQSGVDIIEIERIEKSIQKWGDAFLKRVFSSEEIRYCEGKKTGRFQSYAARFAAKEAVAKLLGTGISGGVSLRDIEVRKNETKRPTIVLYGEAEKQKKFLHLQDISLSLTHCKQYAVAFVVGISRV